MADNQTRVLVLGDEESVRDWFVGHLRKHGGCSVDVAANGEEALHLVDEAGGRYDIVVIDAVLKSSLTGLAVLKQIKSRYPEIELIVFTDGGSLSALEARRNGAYYYCPKPFDLEELVLTIEAAAAHAKMHRERKVLQAMQRVTAAIGSTLDLHEIFCQACKVAVELLGVDHSGLVLFEADYSKGRVVAEYPERFTSSGLTALDKVILVRGVPAEERLIEQREILNVADVMQDDSFGPVRTSS